MKATIVGVRRMRGTSAKSGNQYDMCNVTLLVPVEAVTSAKMVIEGAGFSTMEMPLEPASIGQFQTLKFPAQVTLTTEARPRSGKVETVVTGFEPVSKAA
jgi:hypothetical protein